MEQRQTTASTSEVFEVISRFLASPPAGTPAEILDAFNFRGRNEFLPPRLFLETVEQAPVAISITDPNAKILYVNAVFEQLSGYARAELIGNNQSILSSHSTPTAVYQDLWRTIKARQVWRGTLVNHRRDGGEYLAELTISPVLAAGDGEVGYFLGMHRDISEQHRLEQRLKFQTALIETALNAAPLVMVMLDAERRVVLDNPAYKTLAHEFQGVAPAQLFLEALAREQAADLAQLCQSGTGFANLEVRLDPPGSSTPRWFSCSGVRVTELDEAAHNYFKPSDPQRCYLLLVASDISASRQRVYTARMNLLRTSMAEQQMNQTLREAISAAIFKVQAPLNIIRAALAIPGNGEEHSLRLVLQQALETGSNALAGLQQVLPTPNLEQTSVVNLNELLHEVITLSTTTLLANGIVVDWRPAPVLPHVVGQANALRGLFKYLIDNAIQAVADIPGSYREIRLHTTFDEQDVLIEVADNGPGIEPNHLLRVFEPFFCGWRQHRGHAGMGLTMAQEIVINHNGVVEIDAHFVGGCRVCVRLPLPHAGAHRD